MGSNAYGQATLIWSKAKQEREAARFTLVLGRLHEVQGDLYPRKMITQVKLWLGRSPLGCKLTVITGQNAAYRSTWVFFLTIFLRA
jgi:hypothetical protein